jgi:tetratricopeptide (TPR) repeat protein
VQEALVHYREALRIDPYLQLAHTNLGNLLLALGESEEAFEHFDMASRLAPHQPVPHDGMGVALLYQGNVDAAVLQFQEALRLHPGDELAYNGLGDAWSQRGRLEMAIDNYQRAVRLAPAVAQFHCNLGGAMYDHGEIAPAREEYRLATQVQPAWPQQTRGRAWRLATHPVAKHRNGREAVKLARQVVQACAERPEDLEILAAAYAEAGRFEEAVATQQKALDYASTASPPDRSRKSEERLHLYQKRKPYREQPRGLSP